MISQDIIDKRKSHANRLSSLDERIARVRKPLDGASDFVNRNGKAEDGLSKQLSRLDRLRERVELRKNRYASGLVTIAVAGLEKSGKTTLLKTLTGIEDLPSAPERCTAVPCEIWFNEPHRKATRAQIRRRKRAAQAKERSTIETVGKVRFHKWDTGEDGMSNPPMALFVGEGKWEPRDCELPLREALLHSSVFAKSEETKTAEEKESEFWDRILRWMGLPTASKDAREKARKIGNLLEKIAAKASEAERGGRVVKLVPPLGG